MRLTATRLNLSRVSIFMGTHKLGRRLYANKHQEFLKKIIVNAETLCWEWQAAKNSNGYGRIKYGGKNIGAHRYSYKHYIGEIEDNLMVLHECDNKICCSPFHIHKGDGFLNHKEARDRGLRPSGDHPSQASYKAGCRCEECKAIKKKAAHDSRVKVQQLKTEEQLAKDRERGKLHMRARRLALLSRK